MASPDPESGSFASLVQEPKPGGNLAKGLDPCKPLDDGRIWGVLSKPNPTDPTAYLFYTLPVRTADFEWTPAPVTAKFGFPLQVHMRREIEPPLEVPEQARERMRGPVRKLFFDGDVDSPTFGQYQENKWLGEVLLTRSDGKDMHDLQLGCLFDYLFQHVEPGIVIMYQGHRYDLRPQDIARVTNQTIASNMTPEGFHAFFEEFRLIRMAEGHRQTWERIESPVRITVGNGPVAPACGSCCRTRRDEVEGWPGLKKCGRCDIRWYCGVSCQRSAWKTHKKVCRPPV